ncbi:MAG: cytochrome c oxidase assembly protein [Parvibaculaceae bacterium]|jgi:cytochrome c oxidase assembly protein subunit 11|nr:cytochrome c oxidase assembly protein [Parvibaculaceae bacterium]
MSLATADTIETQQRQHRKVALLLSALVVGMVGMAYAAVPLYDLFCRVTGYGGTTNTADVAPVAAIDRTMTIRFDSNINRGLAWEFKPVELSQEIKVGESGLAFYQARNLSDETLVGTATYNVTPQSAGYYFNKIDCFCFTEQVLRPGETVDMPVTYFVDPEIEDDKNLDHVTTITLSYTFYPKRDVASAAN